MKLCRIDSNTDKASLFRKFFLVNFTCTATNNAFIGIGGLFVTGYALFLGIDASQIGLIASLSMLVNIAQVFSPYILNLFASRKKGIVVLFCCRYLSYLPVILIPLLGLPQMNYVMLAASMILTNLFLSFIGGGLIDWNDRFVDPRNKGKYYANRNMIANIILAVNQIVLGYFLTEYSKHYLMYIIAFALIVLIAICEVGILCRITGPKTDNHQSFNMRQMIMPFRDKIFSKYMAFTCIWGFSTQLCQPFQTYFSITQLKYSYTFIGTVTSLVAVAKIFVARPCGSIGDKMGWGKIVLFAGTAFQLSILMWSLFSPDTQWLYVIVSFLNGISMICINIAIFNIPILLTNPQNRLIYFAANGALGSIFNFLGAFIGSLLIKTLADLSVPVIGTNIYKVLFIAAGILGVGASIYLSNSLKKINELKDNVP